MRWVASLVADCNRILIRGGVFLYPGDARPGYGAGRVRVLYEASPIAFVVEQAGGHAITGQGAVLDVVPKTLHERAFADVRIATGSGTDREPLRAGLRGHFPSSRRHL